MRSTTTTSLLTMLLVATGVLGAVLRMVSMGSGWDGSWGTSHPGTQPAVANRTSNGTRHKGSSGSSHHHNNTFANTTTAALTTANTTFLNATAAASCPNGTHSTTPRSPPYHNTTSSPSASANNDTFHNSSVSSSTLPLPLPPLRIFVLAGQSNMMGMGLLDARNETTGSYRNGTLARMIEQDPKSYGMLRDENGSWTAREDVWITYNQQDRRTTAPEVNKHGRLRAGYGGEPGTERMGPELSFGWEMAEALRRTEDISSDDDRPRILLLKVAWGGRSLSEHFRPPSSGKSRFDTNTTGSEGGAYYRALVEHVNAVVANLTNLFDWYDADRDSWELSGMVWFQGIGDARTFGKRKKVNHKAEEYESNLANLVKDLRTDWGIPNLPVVVAGTGNDGFDPHSKRAPILAAQRAVANATKHPDLAGTVAFAETRGFVPPPDARPGNDVLHWYYSCEAYWKIGRAMAEAMNGLLHRPRDYRA